MCRVLEKIQQGKNKVWARRWVQKFPKVTPPKQIVCTLFKCTVLHRSCEQINRIRSVTELIPLNKFPKKQRILSQTMKRKTGSETMSCAEGGAQGSASGSVEKGGVIRLRSSGNVHMEQVCDKGKSFRLHKVFSLRRSAITNQLTTLRERIMGVVGSMSKGS